MITQKFSAVKARSAGKQGRILCGQRSKENYVPVFSNSEFLYGHLIWAFWNSKGTEGLVLRYVYLQTAEKIPATQ